MTPEERAELDRLSEVERAEIAREVQERDARVAAADERGRMWAEGPPRKQTLVNIEVETEHGTVMAPGTIDPEIAQAMRLEAAGYERDPVTGQWRPGGFYPA
jgi:hypothetical protein